MYRLFCIGFALLLLTVGPIFAQDAPQPAEATGAPTLPLVMPTLENAKTVDEIQEFLAFSTMKIQQEVAKIAQTREMTPEIIGGFLKTLAEQTVAGGEKMLKVAKSDAEKEAAYETLIQGFKQLDAREKMLQLEKLKKEANLSEEDQQNPEKMMPLILRIQDLQTDAQKRLDALFADIEKEGKFTKLIEKDRFMKFVRGSMEIQSDFSAEKFETFKNEAKQWACKGLDDLPPGRVLMMVVELAESENARKADPKIVAKTIKDLTDFVKSDQCSLSAETKKEVEEQLEGYCRRCEGSNPNLYGKTLDDKDFDWASLRGKVVLVKFTASWCGPCKMQIPFMLKAYEKYKDKGFEIVSVYVFEDGIDPVKHAVEEEKIPWIVLSEELTKKAGQPAQGQAFAIEGVPTMVLVDKDGIVIETDIRGQQLDATLEKLLQR